MTNRVFAGAIVLGIVLRLLLFLTSLGTTDVLYWRMWLDLIREHGILGAYGAHSELNHPPLALLILYALGVVGDALNTLVSEPLRVLQIAADLVTAGALWSIARRTGLRTTSAVLLFFLAPASMFVSAFHGNTDSLMIALVTTAIALAVRGGPSATASGAVLALAVGIKIIPLLLVPFFWSASGERRNGFLLGFSSVAGLIFLPGIVGSGSTFVTNVFGYSPRGLEWGLGLLPVLGAPSAVSGYGSVARYVILAAVAVVWLLRGRELRREELPAMCGLVLLLLIVFAPGAGPQYLLWPLPLIVFAGGVRLSIAYAAISGAHLAIVYSVWSREIPWFLADPIRPAPWSWVLPWSALVAWGAIAVVTAMVLRKQVAPTSGAQAD